jgi:polysaccharide deacetylase 2 family uncharacterized protein YibQ
VAEKKMNQNEKKMGAIGAVLREIRCFFLDSGSGSGWQWRKKMSGIGAVLREIW